MFRIDNKIAQNTNLWSLNDRGELEFSYKDDILAEYQSLFKTIFGDINTDASTPQGQIITSLTQIDLATISYLENLANAFFFGGSGDFLDKWAWNLYRVVRKSRTPASVLVTITGKPNTEIPAEFMVSDGNENYVIESPTRIGDNGEVIAKFFNVNVNDSVAKANTITQIVTNVNGVERVNNKENATPAIFRETDAELFHRCLYFGSTATNASFRSILANVAQVRGVKRITGAENVTNSNQMINGVQLTPHSICVVVDGGDSQEIAEAIQKSKATGCDMVGDIEIPLYIDKQRYMYRFYRPKAVELKAKVTISEANHCLIRSDFEKVTKETLASFINSLDIAKAITQPLLSNALIKSIGGGFNVDDLQFSLKSNSLGYAPINLKLNEVASISQDDIEVIKA